MLYGHPALVSSADAYITIEAKKIDYPNLIIESDRFGKFKGSITGENEDAKIRENEGNIGNFQYSVKSIELAMKNVESLFGLKISIKSEIPSNAGMGSSSALTTGLISAVGELSKSEISKKRIIELAHKAESKIQGSASRGGVAAAIYGGCIKIENNNLERLDNWNDPELLIIYSGEKSKTSEMIQQVENKIKNKKQIYRPIIESIGKTSENGIISYKNKNLKKLGALMNVNHNLLKILNLSSDKINKLTKICKNHDVLGSKITGAGGGGCIITLTSNGKKLKDSLSEEADKTFTTKIGEGRLKIER